MKRMFASCCGVLLLLTCCHRQTPQPPANFFSFQLALSDDSRLNFETLKSNKASVFVFLAPDCPQSQSYTLTLNELDETFRNGRVGFYGVVTGKYGRNEIDGFNSQYQIHFPVLLDPAATLARFFDATVTPEAFVVSPIGKPVYRGAIDNGTPELGQHRTVITEHYLLDALNSFITNGNVPVSNTKPVGCFIERGS
jgi:thiol-disulfide isomerase/thioredoxin